jgi:hypothetical protein
MILMMYRLLSPGSEWRLHREWYAHSALPDLLGMARNRSRTAGCFPTGFGAGGVAQAVCLWLGSRSRTEENPCGRSGYRPRCPPLRFTDTVAAPVVRLTVTARVATSTTGVPAGVDVGVGVESRAAR